MLSEAKVSLDYEKSTVFGLEVVGTLVEDQAILDVFLWMGQFTLVGGVGDGEFLRFGLRFEVFEEYVATVET